MSLLHNDTLESYASTSYGASTGSRPSSAHVQLNNMSTDSKKEASGSSPFRERIRLSNIASSYKFRKFPRNKGVWFVFLMFFLHGFAEFSATLIFFFSLVAYHKLNPAETVAVYLAVRCFVFIMYPVMGFLADTFFSRYRVLLFSVHISWIGSAILVFSFAFLDPYLDSNVNKYAYGTDTSWPTNRVVALAVCYAIIWIGFTGIRVNLIPFGIDQLPDASGGELSSYFHWYYWCINAGYLVASTFLPFLYQVTALSYTFFFTIFCFSIIIISLVLFRHEFHILPEIGNPLKMVYRVLKYAMKAKRPRFRSAFEVGKPLPSRIDLAMISNGGRFSTEQVEDVKTFFRILVILLSFFGYFAIFSQLQSTYLLEAIRMQVPKGFYKDCPIPKIPPNSDIGRDVECRLWSIPPSIWLTIANLIPVLLLIPLLDRIIYPILGGHSPTMLMRIGIGKVFLLLSIIVAIGVESHRVIQLTESIRHNDSVIISAIPFHTGSSTTFHVASPAPIYLIIPQFLFFAFAEVLSNITAVEFIYAQSPGHMKGTLLGLLYGTEGIATGFASAIIGMQNLAPDFSVCSFFGNSNFFFNHVATNEGGLDCLARLQHRSDNPVCVDSPLCSYIVFLVIAILSVIGFIVSAVYYKFRRRDPDPYIPFWFGADTRKKCHGVCSCCFS